MIRHSRGECRWDGVELKPYKEDGNLFKSVTRQTLFAGAFDLLVELRYFEVGPGGHSTLERHQHAHLVMVIRGRGKVLVKDQVTYLEMHDLVHIPPLTWHQFRAVEDEPLGFLCVVNQERDRPERPGAGELEKIRECAAAAEFIRV